MNRFARRMALGVLLSCGALVAHADNTAQVLPFAQDWANPALITVSDDWSGVPGIVGYRGDDVTTLTGADPQTLLGEGTVIVDVNAQSLGNNTTGGVLEIEAAGTVAMQGSGTADAPSLVINLNTSGRTGINVAYVLRDLDTSADDAQQQFALQYRVGSSGNFTNVPAGYVADATTANAATQVTPVSATLPAAADNQALVQVRIITSNAGGNDELVGVDDIAITAGGGGQPALSISDVTAVEGDAGTREFLFTVSLSQAAASDVTVSYATADGSATAGSDYVSESGQLAIPAGQTSITFGIVVNGDTVAEPSETFTVELSGASGATLADAQGIGTISNDDVSITPIHDIQGNNNTSPLVGQAVTTRGIVTGRRNNGFFVQAPDANADADPATSEGIFVFTSAALPASAAIGNDVIVSGTVVEFTPAADPGQLSLTEITGPTVTLVSIGNALPTPVQLTPTFPDPEGPLDQLERAEGMRVTAASFTVVAATGGSTNEPNATGSSNGQVNLVVTGTPRPFREPGIQAPDPAPGGGSIPPIPRWDFNPELLFSDTDALGGTPYNLAVGATLTNYVGPLDYGFRRYSVHQDPTVAPTITQGPAPSAARAPTADEFTYASYNMERFFDTVNDPDTGEPVLTTAAYANRLNKASLGIRNFLNTPDIIGVVEVENLSTLQAVAAKVNADAVAAMQPDPQYVAYLEEGNDVGGIDVGFLVKTAEVAAGAPRVDVEDVVQLGADETWNDPVNGPGTLLNDRPPLLMDAVVNFADGRSLPITAIVVHQRSLNGAETDDAEGARVRSKRHLQALYLAQQIDLMQDADPTRNITVAGDFNAFEFNDGLVDAMGTVSGMPSPDNATAVAGDGADALDEDLLNLFVEEPADQRYSFEFDGNAQSLDHVLINQALGAAVGAVDLDHARINADFPEVNRNDANSASRLSDHDPAIAYFSVASADLAIVASASPASVGVGGAMTFSATVSNEGPDAAAFPGVGFAFDAALPDLAITAPAGWSCDTPTVSGGSTSASCASTTSLADGGTAAFQLTANAPANESGNAINMAASVDAGTYDPVGSNNSASASVAVTAAADLKGSISGPVFSGGNVSYTVLVENAGPSDVASATVAISGGLPANAVSATSPTGWTCAQGSGVALSLTCQPNAGAPFVAGGSAPFVLTFPRSYNKPAVRLQGSVNSAATDPNPGNNTARRRLGIPAIP
jgi:uncharacterized protein